MNANIEAQLNAMLAHRNAINEAINLRAGETLINADAGLIDAPEAILNIPTDSNTLYYKTDDTSAYQKIVPRGAQPMTQLISVGGMTRVETGANLLTYATTDGIVDTPVNTGQEYPVNDNWDGVILPSGTYKFSYDAVQSLTSNDENISPKYSVWVYGQILDVDGGYNDMGNGAFSVQNGEEFTLTEDKKFWLMSFFRGISSETQITATYNTYGQSGQDGWNSGEIHLNSTTAIEVPSDYATDITITTNVPITVSSTRELTGSYEYDVYGTDFTLGVGKHELKYRNVGDDDYLDIKITETDISLIDVSATIFPMVYDAALDLDEYEPYRSDLVPTPVSEVVSEGTNILPSDVYNVSSWTPSPTSAEWYNYPLNLSDGWYCITTKVKDNYSGNTYFYLRKSTDGGVTGTSLVVGYNGSGTTTSGYLITSNGVEQPAVWFKVDNNAGIVYRLTCYQISQSKLDEIAYVQIQRANLTQEPSTAYPPGTYAPATEYQPYVGTIDTVAIPDAVKNDASWGYGIKYTRDGITSLVSNDYNFNAKKYTEYIPEKVILDGTEGHRFTDTSVVGSLRRFHFALQGECKDYASVMATNFTTNYADAIGNVYLFGSNAYFFLPSDITTVAQANNWLEEHPTEMVYALAEPTVTTVEDDSYTPPKFIKTEAGGTITFENEAKESVPSSVKYLIDLGGI